MDFPLAPDTRSLLLSERSDAKTRPILSCSGRGSAESMCLCSLACCIHLEAPRRSNVRASHFATSPPGCCTVQSADRDGSFYSRPQPPTTLLTVSYHSRKTLRSSIARPFPSQGLSRMFHAFSYIPSVSIFYLQLISFRSACQVRQPREPPGLHVDDGLEWR